MLVYSTTGENPIRGAYSKELALLRLPVILSCGEYFELYKREIETLEDLKQSPIEILESLLENTRVADLRKTNSN